MSLFINDTPRNLIVIIVHVCCYAAGPSQNDSSLDKSRCKNCEKRVSFYWLCIVWPMVIPTVQSHIYLAFQYLSRNAFSTIWAINDRYGKALMERYSSSFVKTVRCQVCLVSKVCTRHYWWLSREMCYYDRDMHEKVRLYHQGSVYRKALNNLDQMADGRLSCWDVFVFFSSYDNRVGPICVSHSTDESA